MLGLEIQINNEPPITAAAENFTFAILTTTAAPDEEGYITVRGKGYGYGYHWLDARARQGDKVTVRIIQTDKASPPLKTQKDDRKKMLERYAQLKKELEEKGLIAKEG